MSAILRYDLIDANAITAFVFSFPTEGGLKAHLSNSMPAEARNVDMFWMDESPRQSPTFPDRVPSYHPAWEAETGKRPAITCPIDITQAAPARRRNIYSNNHGTAACSLGVVTGYTTI